MWVTVLVGLNIMTANSVSAEHVKVASFYSVGDVMVAIRSPGEGTCNGKFT